MLHRRVYVTVNDDGCLCGSTASSTLQPPSLDLLSEVKHIFYQNGLDQYYTVKIINCIMSHTRDPILFTSGFSMTAGIFCIVLGTVLSAPVLIGVAVTGFVISIITGSIYMLKKNQQK